MKAAGYIVLVCSAIGVALVVGYQLGHRPVTPFRSVRQTTAQHAPLKLWVATIVWQDATGANSTVFCCAAPYREDAAAQFAAMLQAKHPGAKLNLALVVPLSDELVEAVGASRRP